MRDRTQIQRGYIRLRVLGILAILFLAAAPLRAQELGSLLASSTELQRDRASDMITGQNVKGPYTLTRRVILAGSETVYINGARAFRPADYQIDYTSGSVTFAYPLPSGQAARVDYYFDRKRSTANLQALKTPLSLNLADMQLGAMMHSTLKFNGVWTNTTAGSPTLSALGMGLDTKLGSSTNVGTVLAITPHSARTEEAGNELDATLMRLTAQTNLKNLQARANFQRTGRAFAAAQQYNVNKGTQLLDLSTAYAFNKYLTASSSVQRTDLLTADGSNGLTTTVVKHEVNAAMSPSARLTYAHTARSVEAGDTQQSNTVTDRVQVDQKLGQLATAQVRHEITTSETGDQVQPVATTAVKVNANVPGGTLVTAERVETRTKEQDPLVNTQVGLSTRGPAGLKLVGQYSQRVGADTTPEELRSAQVEAAPVNGIKLSGGVLQQQTGTDAQTQKNAAVEIKTYAGLQVVGRLNSQVDANGTALGITRSVDARLKPCNALEIAGAYKEREQAAVNGPFTRSLRVNLAPVKFFQVNGSVIDNPEENGSVAQEQRRTLGLRSNIGPLALSGNYAQRLSPATITLAQEMEVNLALQISKYDRLFSAYKLADETASTGLTTQQYSFGYTRSLGDTFGLSLEGEYLRYLEGDQELSDRNEARAKAGLNARF
ncbi:MAG TPA: hypothetical protein VHR86_05100 [Armatimonadota bacterium]|nr:hypothetical protein [Armatimonadota bacterium]